jgi:predicted NAD/FAD-dependent oxidoreductase
MMMHQSQGVVIIGASVAGMHAAEQLHTATGTEST